MGSGIMYHKTMKPKKEQIFQASNQILSAQELNRIGNGQPLSVNRRDSVDSEDLDEYVDLNNYATKKAASAGALGTGLLSSNADQLKTALQIDQKTVFDYTKIGLLGVSIALQIVTMSLMFYLGSNGRVKNLKRKKKQDPINNICMVLSFLITVISIFITVF